MKKIIFALVLSSISAYAGADCSGLNYQATNVCFGVKYGKIADCSDLNVEATNVCYGVKYGNL